MNASVPSCARKNASISSKAGDLSRIYQADNNIAIWQRQLSQQMVSAAKQIIKTEPTLQIVTTLTLEETYDTLFTALGGSSAAALLSQDINQLVEMYCFLFELKSVGLRLTQLNRAMCPRFHVDRVPARLITTYRGSATEWLDHQSVDRSKLGMRNLDQPDEHSGLYQYPSDINQINAGDVAILKGELWPENQGKGLVHRSPNISSDNPRLLLTLDFPRE